MKKFFLSLAILPLSAIATDGYLCSDCTSQTAAQSVALRDHVPKLICVNPNPDFELELGGKLVCGSTPNKIALVNPNSGQVFTFSVGHLAANNQPHLFNHSISDNDRNLFSAAGIIYKNFKVAVDGVNQSRLNEISGNTQTSRSNTCPDNTALAALVDPNKMVALENQIRAQLMGNSVAMGNIQTELNRNDAFGSISDLGITVGNGFGQILVNNSKTDPITRIHWGFRESEGGEFLSDFLLFDIKKLRNDLGSEPIILDITLNDLSRVAGDYTISHLKGKYGPVQFEDPCIVDKLEQLGLTGEFKNSQGGPTQFPDDHNQQPEGGGSIETCTIYFYQSGRLLYVFRLLGRCT
ncbi:hypothetical protein [Shewanella sp. GXUN23E]|uniref:hypothetical protein n=1 Tax=Shewanella sp. GXUN23E TaxID=3422498 RepID=UPI003D7CDA5A